MLKLFSFKTICKIFILIFYNFLIAEQPFLEIRPYAPPSFEQYPVSQQLDHQYPTSNITDNLFFRFDGFEFEGNVIYPDCLSGTSCYDGHAGVDFHMPFDTPIIAPANGYVLWASFTEPANPCPGGIEPNGNQGTIILAHGNDYFTVYLHMNPPLNVSVGENVLTGDTLGFNGNTGCAINAHLHFEVRKGNWFFDTDESWAVDPYGWWGNSIDPIQDIRNNISEWLWISSTLIDDGDNGFQRYQGPEWSYLNFGFNEDAWVAPATTNESESRHFSIWVPYLEESGEYEIEAFIPDGFNATTGAIYEVIIQDTNNLNTKYEFIVDQTINPGAFNSIATLDLPSGSNCSIILRDRVQESSSGTNVFFDAVKFTNTASVGKINEKIKNFNHNNLIIFPAYPNPFNPKTSIRYKIKKTNDISIKIYNSNGILVDSFIINNQQKGTHIFNWEAKNTLGRQLSSGIYFIIFEIENNIDISKIVLIR